MTPETEIQQHKTFLRLYNKAKKDTTGIQIKPVLIVDKKLYKERLMKAIDNRQGNRWIVDETLKLGDKSIAFVIEGEYWEIPFNLSGKVDIEIKKIHIIDSENIEYKLEVDENPLGLTAEDEIEIHYSTLYTESIQIQETDKI